MPIKKPSQATENIIKNSTAGKKYRFSNNTNIKCATQNGKNVADLRENLNIKRYLDMGNKKADFPRGKSAKRM